MPEEQVSFRSKKKPEKFIPAEQEKISSNSNKPLKVLDDKKLDVSKAEATTPILSEQDFPDEV